MPRTKKKKIIKTIWWVRAQENITALTYFQSNHHHYFSIQFVFVKELIGILKANKSYLAAEVGFQKRREWQDLPSESSQLLKLREVTEQFECHGVEQP